MTAYLLDVNVLIALAWPNHVHHGPATSWFRQEGRNRFATCAITESGFIRISMNPAVVGEAASFQQARSFLTEFCHSPNHVFWPLEESAGQAMADLHISGHRQVIDAYLLTVARRNTGRLATFDTSIAHILPAGSPLADHLLTIPF